MVENLRIRQYGSTDFNKFCSSDFFKNRRLVYSRIDDWKVIRIKN